jgi:hypothetical protein
MYESVGTLTCILMTSLISLGVIWQFYALLLCYMYVDVLAKVPQLACSSVTTLDLTQSGSDS